jgi:hypothetical protein
MERLANTVFHRYRYASLPGNSTRTNLYNKAGKASEYESCYKTRQTQNGNRILSLDHDQRLACDIETFILEDEYIETQRRREHWPLP